MVNISKISRDDILKILNSLPADKFSLGSKEGKGKYTLTKNNFSAGELREILRELTGTNEVEYNKTSGEFKTPIVKPILNYSGAYSRETDMPTVPHKKGEDSENEGEDKQARKQKTDEEKAVIVQKILEMENKNKTENFKELFERWKKYPKEREEGRKLYAKYAKFFGEVSRQKGEIMDMEEIQRKSYEGHILRTLHKQASKDAVKKISQQIAQEEEQAKLTNSGKKQKKGKRQTPPSPKQATPPSTPKQTRKATPPKPTIQTRNQARKATPPSTPKQANRQPAPPSPPAVAPEPPMTYEPDFPRPETKIPKKTEVTSYGDPKGKLETGKIFIDTSNKTNDVKKEFDRDRKAILKQPRKLTYHHDMSKIREALKKYY